MIPRPINTLLRSRFDYPKRIIIAQVATLSVSGPDLRSMGLFDIDAEGRLIFLTNTFSNKWSQLSLSLGISILLLNHAQDTQVIARGHVELLTLDSSPELSELYWHRVPEGAKQTYAHEKPESDYIAINISSTASHPPKNFGMIRITPNSWESLDINAKNYTASHRIRYDRDKTAWLKTRLNAI